MPKSKLFLTLTHSLISAVNRKIYMDWHRTTSSWENTISLLHEAGSTLPTSGPVDLRLRALVWKRSIVENVGKGNHLRSAHHSTRETPPQLRVGDVVIVENNNSRPLFWKLGRVTLMFPGRYTVTRASTWRLSSDLELFRPIIRLYLLYLSYSTPPGAGCWR